MGRVYDGIDERLGAFLMQQPVFFVGTAPVSTGGYVNVSPKGRRGTFVVLDAHRVAYLDLTGSGVETVAHLRENGRITLMFCAFEGPPRIVRLSGRGEAVLPGDPRFGAFVSHFPTMDGIRSVVVIDVARVADSCGYGVPQMNLVRERDRLTTWTLAKGESGLAAYRREKNSTSIDGLPGIDP